MQHNAQIMMPDVLDAHSALDREKALSLAALAATVWCGRSSSPSRSGDELLRRLMMASAWVSRTRRHHGLAAFSLADLVASFDQPVDSWLPGGGAFALVEDGAPTPICQDLADDSGASVLAEVEQRVIKTAMDNLLGRDDEAAAYTAFRRFLVEHAHASHAEAAEAVQAVGLELSQVYGRVSARCEVIRDGQRVFYPCPRCRWPMAVRDRYLTCERSPVCLTSGARFAMEEGGLLALGRLAAPDAVPVRGSAALLPGIWRFTVLPGLEELELANRLLKLPGVEVQLWPYVDAYDLDVRLGNNHHWRIDVKDHTSVMALVRHLNERPRREVTWIVVPDQRKDQVPVLQRHVQPEAGYQFACSSEIVRRVKGAV